MGCERALGGEAGEGLQGLHGPVHQVAPLRHAGERAQPIARDRNVHLTAPWQPAHEVHQLRGRLSGGGSTGGGSQNDWNLEEEKLGGIKMKIRIIYDAGGLGDGNAAPSCRSGALEEWGREWERTDSTDWVSSSSITADSTGYSSSSSSRLVCTRSSEGSVRRQYGWIDDGA